MLIKRYKDILPYNWRTVKIPVENPKPGEDHNKFVTMMQINQNAIEMQPKCDKNTTKMQSNKMLSKCNQNAIKQMLSKHYQSATKILLKWYRQWQWWYSWYHSRYINASWILFKGYKQKFIASQVTRNLHLHLHYDLNLHLMLIPTKAPIEDTIGDFWHCVAYHKVRFHQTLSQCPIAPKHYLDAQ